MRTESAPTAEEQQAEDARQERLANRKDVLPSRRERRKMWKATRPHKGIAFAMTKLCMRDIPRQRYRVRVPYPKNMHPR